MLLRSIGAALLSAGAAQAFKNSSPFVLLSTQQPEGGLESAVVNTADKVTDGILAAVGDCALSEYTILRQEGVTVADIQEDVTPLLKARARAGLEDYAQQVKIDNVISEIDMMDLVKQIASRCGAVKEDTEGSNERKGQWSYKGEGKQVFARDYFPLPQASELADPSMVDMFKIGHEIASIGRLAPEDHMIIILSAPAAPLDHANDVYEMDEPYPTAMHQDLKRDIKYEPLKSSNKTMQAGLPLFEKYQFLTPGIFMALTVSLLLLVILWVGVSAIAGLEVSYMAFSKEMGPAAQNKGKQQ